MGDVGGGAASIAENGPAMIPVGQTLGWIINLIVAEAIIRRGRPNRLPAARRLAAVHRGPADRRRHLPCTYRYG
ncbi:hypothetical protein ACTI_73670 [Actinoplanes sp. OR16]|nr:hypothetical protein ACTI_73670 [Actinoplanes sp. OR16]